MSCVSWTKQPAARWVWVLYPANIILTCYQSYGGSTGILWILADPANRTPHIQVSLVIIHVTNCRSFRKILHWLDWIWYLNLRLLVRDWKWKIDRVSDPKINGVCTCLISLLFDRGCCHVQTHSRLVKALVRQHRNVFIWCSNCNWMSMGG